MKYFIRILCLVIAVVLFINVISSNGQEERKRGREEERKKEAWEGMLKDGTIISNEELSKILNEHKWWLLSVGRKGKQADLRGADLSEADLSGANLSEAKMRDTKLIGAKLRGANLKKAFLIKADLTGADLSGADLRGADLSEADLEGADMRDASLRGVNFNNANVKGADFKWARHLTKEQKYYLRKNGALNVSETALIYKYYQLQGSKLFQSAYQESNKYYEENNKNIDVYIDCINTDTQSSNSNGN